jgi:hypothetical protein
MSNGITEDLMDKIADDVTFAMKRTLALAPNPLLPVAMNGGAVAIGIVAAVLAEAAGKYEPKSKPDVDTVLLAALLCARVGTDVDDGIAQAYRDLEALRSARLAAR